MNNPIFGLPAQYDYSKSIDLWLACLGILIFAMLSIPFTRFFHRRLNRHNLQNREKTPNPPLPLIALYSALGFALTTALLLSCAKVTSSMTDIFTVLSAAVGVALVFRYQDAALRRANLAITFGECAMAIQLFKSLYWSAGIHGAEIGMTVLLAIAFFEIAVKFRQRRQSGDGTRLAAAPLILLILLNSIPRMADLTVPGDDYHFGETLLASQRFALGEIPYRDFLPAHGLMNALPGKISALLFGSTTPVEIYFSFQLMKILCLLGAGMLMASWFPAPLAALFVALAPFDRPSYFLVSAFFFWCAASLRHSPIRAAASILVFTPALLFFEVSVGIAFALPFAFLFYIALTSILRLPDRQRRYFYIAVVGTLVQIVLAIATGALPGLISSLRENAAVNLEAYGRPWLAPKASPEQVSILELVKFAWIPFVGILLGSVVGGASFRWLRRWVHYPRLLVVVVIVPALLMIPYSMGRIDPDWSRTGLVTQLYFLIFLALMAILSWSYAPPRLMRVFVAAVFCVVIFVAKSNSGSFLTKPLTGATQSPSPYTPEHREMLTRFSSLVSEAEKALSAPLTRDDFFDLTNRNALYAYSGIGTTLPITAYYNMAHPAQEERILNLLKAHPPKLILVAGDEIVHDGSGPALRIPRIWDHLMSDPQLNLFVNRDGYVFFLRSQTSLGSALKISRESWFQYVAQSSLHLAPQYWARKFGNVGREGFGIPREKISTQAFAFDVAPKISHMILAGDCERGGTEEWFVFPKESPQQRVSFRVSEAHFTVLIPVRHWPQLQNTTKRIVVEHSCDSLNLTSARAFN